ncbi:RND transporter [Pedobacter yulinensis]|uniref:RND transporter n=1 Tax=Pedobacter yulinensis TaxID=2126353 RepID=A0A2T3HPE6_9SPHI|nr:TolC family protein [Pedobacter yulinensis]PST84277.1 RND transporter [Pedobacter yulinensis]
MLTYKTQASLLLAALLLAAAGCKIPVMTQRNENRSIPDRFAHPAVPDRTSAAALPWQTFFNDSNLVALIDTAVKNNQELNITMQEISLARNDVHLRQAPLRPVVGARIGAGLDKPGRYTSQGAGDASTEIEPGKPVPDPLADFGISLYANWEIDIWKKLRNAKKAALARYLATVEGKNFVLTNLIAEVARTYYELLALDNQLAVVQQTIALQQNALKIVRIQKEAARTTELAVQKFQAEVQRSLSLEFEVRQKITEAENTLNLLLGRYPQAIKRNSTGFLQETLPVTHTGLPAMLLSNRPDIRKAELELSAAKLDVKIARAEFYPSLGITAALGVQAFKPSYLVKLPESMLYSMAGDLAAPLVNRAAIKAEFYNANARQVQAMYNYERTILAAYLEVSTQLAKIANLKESYGFRSEQVAALDRSTAISNALFRSARADYLEVLMTQRDALEAKLELIETKKDQLLAVTNVYRDLGGGWK